MNRLAVAAIAGIALLTLGGLLVIVLATRDGASAPPAPTPVPALALPEATSPGASGPVAPTLPLGAPSTPQPQRPEVWLPAPPPPPKDSWEAVPPAARPAALGLVGGAVGRELLELKPRLDACFDEDTQARFGPKPHTTVQDYAPIDSPTTTILMLQLEETDGAVRIVDAPVESQGRASDGLVACAQQVLRGRVVRAPQARAGARHRLMYTLSQ